MINLQYSTFIWWCFVTGSWSDVGMHLYLCWSGIWSFILFLLIQHHLGRALGMYN